MFLTTMRNCCKQSYMLRNRALVGVDGCREGWIAVIEYDRRLEARVRPNWSALIAGLPKTALIGVDIRGRHSHRPTASRVSPVRSRGTEIAWAATGLQCVSGAGSRCVEIGKL